MRAVIVAVLAVLVLIAVSANAQCKVGDFDLSSLKTTDGVTDTIQDPFDSKGQWEFFLNFCANANSVAKCGTTASAPAVQWVSSSNTCKVLGQLPMIPGATDAKSATFVYDMGTPYSDGTPRKTQVKISCATDAGKTDGTLEFDKEYPAPNRYYGFNFYSNVVCGGGPGPGPGPNPPNNGGGLSGGSIFLIIFFCGAAVYVGVGMLVKWKFYKASGCELVPNTDFWKQLPGLLLDGLKFTFCCGRATYTKV